MKIVITSEYRSLHGILQAGEVLNLPSRFARRLILAGLAEELPHEDATQNRQRWRDQKDRQYLEYKSVRYA